MTITTVLSITVVKNTINLTMTLVTMKTQAQPKVIWRARNTHQLPPDRLVQSHISAEPAMCCAYYCSNFNDSQWLSG